MKCRVKRRRSSFPTGFRRADEGSVATIAALAMIPILIAIGVGLDVSRAMSSRNNLQDALDNTALALAHLPAGTAQQLLNQKAQDWLNANLNDKGMGQITITVTPTTGQLALTARTTVTTTLMGIAGIRTMPLTVDSTVAWGLGHVEVALVLDNTGSMSGTKLATLKTAAAGLVDALAAGVDASDPTALKIAVVPFSMTVNIGATYRTQSWMSGIRPTAYNDSGGDIFSSPSVNRFTMLTQMGVTWGGCVESRPQPYDVQDTPPGSNGATKFVPYFAPDEPDDNSIVSGSGYWGTSYYDFNNDYRPDGMTGADWKARQGRRQKYNGAPASGTSGATGYALGPNAGCALTPLLRLTTNMTTVKSKLNQMVAIGDTNVPFGLMWGWHALSPNAPFADGVAYSNQDTKKIVVLLTDGENTMGDANNPNDSNYNGMGYIWQGRLGITSGSSTTRGNKIDERMALVCTNMKNAGVVIYAVRIDLSGTAPAALSGCASDGDKFYDVPDVANLSAAFANIAGSIGRLRISD